VSIILFIVILGVLVFVHELGHFLVAKRAGIRVDEFAIGFPPRIISRKVGETVYSINLIPFGGYVKIYGEDMLDVPADDKSRQRSFVGKNRGVQALVLVAGIVANIIFAWALISLTFMTGAPVSSTDYEGIALQDERIMVVSVFEASPAEIADIKAGDVVRFIADGAGEKRDLDIEGIQQFVASHEGKSITLGIERKGEAYEISVVPAKGVVGEEAGIGISMDEVGTLKLSFFSAFLEGAKRTYSFLMLTAQGLWDFLYRLVIFNADFSQISGPVGIATLVGEAQSLGLFYVLTFTAIISLNLAVINLVPFPALDGGRLLFVIIESVIRRSLPAKFLHWINAAGFILLLALLLFVTYKDILRFF